MEEIRSDDGTIIAIVIRKDFNKKGINFVSKEDYSLQLGINSYREGDKIKPHFHINRQIIINTIQEIVHIENGRTIVNLYDLNNNKFNCIELFEDDTIFFINGGHGFEILTDTKIIEVKQGPYDGKNSDKKMIGDNE